MSISVVISAFNEERKIEECLRSVGFADEIILIDNSSSDKTAQIAHKYTSKIFTRPNNPMLNINKNFGFSKASGDWILSIDADERVTPQLQNEIKRVLKNPKANGYWIPRKNIIFGKWIEHTGWYPDYVMRLFKKEKGKFPTKHVHEFIDVEGQKEHLKNNLIHYNYDSFDQFLRKMPVYIESESKNLIENGYSISPSDAIRFPFEEFLSRFFAREGYKDGLHGLVLSLLMAFYHLGVFVNIWEKKKFTELNRNSLALFEGETRDSARKIRHWLKNEKIKSTRNPLKKLLLKVK